MASLFQAQWTVLCDKKATSQKRAASYTVITSHLKDPNISQDFYQALYDTKIDLITKILEDIRCKSCDHAALQVLGYCLYIPQLCDTFSPDMIQVIVNGVCGVIQDEDISKSVCTRALWTLSNQRLSLADHVTSIVSVVTELVMSPRLVTPTVDSEALNVLIRLSEQGQNVFTSSPHLWYPAIFTLSLYDLPRISSKALTFSISMATHLVDNQVVISWLTKELKKNAISKMLTQLGGRGQTTCHVLSVWNHVINILGTSLHKHGSFLNDLLRVVEGGFKHRSLPVQVAAYNSWMVLISNYAINLELFTSQKRLKLLLMPLVTSAARNKQEQVENARISAYWHLIGHLGHHKEELFQQVCVPFLLLCLGLDPKTETTKFMSRFQTFNTRTVAKETLSETETEAPKEKENVSKETPPVKSAVSAENSELSEEVVSKRSTGSLSSDMGSKYNMGDLLKFVHSMQAQSKHMNHYIGEPTVTMVMTGCHALLQFIGIKIDVSESLLTSDIDRYTVYPKFLVPMETAEFFTLFLDCLLSHKQIFTTADDGALLLETAVHHLVSVLVCCIDSEQAPPQDDSNRAYLIFDVLIRLVESGCLDSVICKQMRYDILRQLCSVPAQLSSTCGGWRRLLGVLLGNCKTEQLSDWFSNTYRKLLTVATTLFATSDPLRNLDHIIRKLDECAKVGGASEEHLSFMWLLTTKSFCNVVNETSIINLGTTLEPDISLVGIILKFPFLYLIPNGNKDSVANVIQLWKETFDISSRHASLVVKDPNYCTQLVAKELYTAYSVHVKANKSSKDEVRSFQIKFDRFQNAVATAIHHIVERLSWSALHTAANKGQRSGCILTILSLLSWQLVTLGDSALSLSQLTSPAVVMATVSMLYQQATTEEMIAMVTESLAQPLTVCMETAFKLDRVAQTKTHQKQQNELLGYVTITWKTILTVFQTRYTGQYDTSLLAMVSPLLVSALSSELPNIIDTTLTFWKLTFDAHSTALVYPPKLKDYFQTYIRSDNHMRLKLPGIAMATAPNVTAASTQDLLCHLGNTPPRHSVTMSPSRHDNVLPRGDVSPGPIVHPVTSSPQKNVRGSFMNRHAHTSGHAPNSSLKSHPFSPVAKALDAVLTHSVSRDKRGGSRDRRGGSRGKRGGSHDTRGGAKEVSARRKLSLSRDNEQYVPIAPPTKRPRLLTQRQKERLREKHALDHSQDLPLSETQTQNMDDDDVIITHMSPPTNLEKCADSEVVISMVPNTRVNLVSAAIINPSVTTPVSAAIINPSVTTPVSATIINTSVTTPGSAATIINPSVTTELPSATEPVSTAIKHVTTATTKSITMASTATAKSVTRATTAATMHGIMATRPITTSPVTVVIEPTTNPVTMASTATAKSVTRATTAATMHGIMATIPIITSPVTVVIEPTTNPVTMETASTTPVSTATTPVSTATTIVNPSEKVSESGSGIKSLSLRTRRKQVSKPHPSEAAAVMLTTQAGKMLKLPQEKSLSKLHNLRGDVVPHMRTKCLEGSSTATTSLSPIEEMPQENLKSSESSDTMKEGCEVVMLNIVKINKMTAIKETESVPENVESNSQQITENFDIDTTPLKNAHPTYIPTLVTDSYTSTASHTLTLVTASHTPTPITASHTSTHSTEGRPIGAPTDIGFQTYSRDSDGKIVCTGNVQKTKSDSLNKSKNVRREGDFPGDGDFPGRQIFGTCLLNSSHVKTDNSKGSNLDNAVTGVVDMATNSEPNIKNSTEKVLAENTAVAIGGNEQQKLEASKKKITDDRDKVAPPPSDPPSNDGNGVEVDNDDMTTVEDTQMEVENNEEKLEETNVEKMQVQNDELEATNDDKRTAEDTSTEATNDEKTQKEVRKDECEDLEDPLQVVKDKLLATPTHQRTVVATPTHQRTVVATPIHQRIVVATPIHQSEVEATPTHRRSSDPAGILKHISQFDTPSTAKSERRVQFGGTTVHVPASKEVKTPSHARAARAPQAVFSSRRTLLTLLTPPHNKMITVPKPPVTPSLGSCDLVYPSLTECPSPIEQILPSLSASKSTHGLVQLVRARNITTVGNISSLTEQQAQTLPIKSPKVINLRNALRSFEQNLGSKRKSSTSDADSTILPPTKVAKTTTEPETNSDPLATSKETTDVLNSKNVFEDPENIIPNTPEPTFNLSTPDSELVAMGDDKPHPPSEDLDMTPDLLPSVEQAANNMPLMKVTEHDQTSTELNAATETASLQSSILHDHLYCSQPSATTNTSNRGSHDTGSESHDMESVSHDTGSGSHDTGSGLHDMGSGSIVEPVNRDKLRMGSIDHTYCRADVAPVSQELFSEADHTSTEQQQHASPQVPMDTSNQSIQEAQSSADTSKTKQSSILIEDQLSTETSDSVVEYKEPIKDVAAMSESDWTLLGELLSRGANNCHNLSREKIQFFFKKSNRFSKTLFTHKT